MAKKLFAVLLGFALAPAFIAAEDSFVGSGCLVRVYHTQFAFPPEGGRIVQIGNELFFWRSYLPDCQNVLPGNQQVVVTASTGTTPAAVPNGGSLHGAFGPQIVGEPCAVRVYHVDFRFPPEGGKIIQLGNELYFIRTYNPGCENAGAAGTVLASSGSTYNPLQTNPKPMQSYVNPMFTSVSQNSAVTTAVPQAYVAPTQVAAQPTTCY
jgi:hypothetical protein